MNFQCKDCGGNMVYSPKKKLMFCPYCDGENSESQAGNDSLTVCASCGGDITSVVGDFTSATKCPYCGNYLILDQRVTNEFKPDSIIPFAIDKDEAVQAMDNCFKKRLFAPMSFLTEKSLEEMKGCYVPFFLYDFDAKSDFTGEGTTSRSWRTGDYQYTETSYYAVSRSLNVSFDNIPADASESMPDNTMDLLEPFNYQELMSFDPKYLSGFFGEIYNNSSAAYENRAKDKAVHSVGTIMRDSMKQYNHVTPSFDQTVLSPGKVDYTLFPVWFYSYKFGGMVYDFFVNGQTGKVIGKTPVSKKKVWIYGLTFGAVIYAIVSIVLMLITV